MENTNQETFTSSDNAGCAKKSFYWSRLFTNAAEDPFSSVRWETREVSIENQAGERIFYQQAVECPIEWSQTAVSIVASRYFAGSVVEARRERSVKQLISRVVACIRTWGISQEYFENAEQADIFAAELSYALLHQMAAFNSPVWFNVGVHEKPQCSACFILSVEDSIESLIELQATEVKLFKFGSGAGSNLSKIRSSKERLSNGGNPSGPVSFMRGYDAWANTIKSGGKTRRAAKMQILDVTHPDIIEFIECKKKEEQKAWALMEAGYEARIGAPGGAYDSVMFQNSNISVRASDEFMNAAAEGRTYFTQRIFDGAPCEELKAREILCKIAESAHLCGDPGMQFDSTINRWHTCPNSGRINASNPCSEYMHLDNSACNLSSINLLKFIDEKGEFNPEKFAHVIRLLITAQDILIDNSSYPTPEIEKGARQYRQLGLGYSNLGALLMRQGIPYDSDAGRTWAAAITAMLTGEAYRTSARLAAHKGPFVGFRKNRKAMLEVMSKHHQALASYDFSILPKKFHQAIGEVWDDVEKEGSISGFRNAQTTVLAPTGTISFMMDCDTTGIEPDIALVKYKKLVGGGLLKLVNQSVEPALRAQGYSPEQCNDILSFIDTHDTIEGAPHLKASDLAVFDCALKPAHGSRSVHYQGHLKMMASVQPFLSGAISKTVNLSHDCSVEEIMQIFIEAWKLGIKAVALYRDGSKRLQPLNVGKQALSAAKETERPLRRKLPSERKALTHKFSVAGLEGYITVGLYEDGAPGEIFLTVAKEGSTLSGVMDAFATSISLALQYGVPLPALVRKFTHMRFEPAGFTGNSEIPSASSIVDYVFKWLANRFLNAEERKRAGLISNIDGGAHLGETLRGEAGAKDKKSAPNSAAENFASIVQFEDSPPCTACGSSLMVRQGSCYVCLNCGTQGGCG